MEVINISDNTSLIKFIQCLEHKLEDANLDRNLYIAKVLKHFPFNQLVQVTNIDVRNFKSIGKLLKYFVCCEDFVNNLRNLEHTFKFLTYNIQCIITQMENNNDLVHLLMDVLYQLILRVINIKSIKMDINIIFDFIKSLTKSSCIEYYPIKETSCNIFTHIINCDKSTNLDVDVTIGCITDLLMVIKDDLLLSLQVVNAINKAQFNCLIPKLESVTVIVESSIGCINKNTNNEIIINFMEAIYGIYAYSNNVELINRITEQMLNKFDCICYCLKNTESATYAAKIMEAVIIKSFPEWNNQNLKKEINMLTICENWSILSCDIIFIICYIEVIYLKYKHGPNIVNLISRKLSSGVPTNITILKSILLLYSVYLYKNEYLGKDLINLLSDSQHIALLLTYKPPQLIWILYKGPKHLKLKVLKLWIVNYKNDKDIINCIKICKSSLLLIHLLLYSTDEHIENRIIDLLRDFDDPVIAESIKNMIPHIANTEPKKLGTILNVCFAVPKDIRVAVVVATKITIVVTKLDCLEAIRSCLNCSKRLLFYYEYNTDIVMPFNKKYFINYLIKLTSHDNDELAIEGIMFLTKMGKIHSQHQFLTNLNTTVDLHLMLKGSETRINHSLRLLHFILSAKNKNSFLTIEVPSHDLYNALLNLRKIKSSAAVYKLLTYLLKAQEVMVTNYRNIYVIKKECRQKTYKPDFLAFLKTWLRLAGYCSLYISVPYSQIKLYLNSLGKDDKVQDISNLLNKWQLKSPPLVL